MKKEIRLNYSEVEPDKIPEHIKEFLDKDSKDIAIELGFYNPENDAESAMIIKGSTLGFDESGDLVIHDIRSGEDNVLIDSDTPNEWNKYEGKMFDSDNSGQKIEPTTEIEQTEPKIVNLDEQGNVIQPEVDADKLSPTDVLNQTNPNVTDTPLVENQTDTIPQVEPKVTNLDEQNIENNQEDQQEATAEKEEPLNVENRIESLNFFRESIGSIYGENSTAKIMIWDKIKDLGITEFINRGPEDDSWKELYKNQFSIFKDEALADSHTKLWSYLQQLKEISGLQPKTEELWQSEESITQFMDRAIGKIQELGRLDEVKL